MATRKGKRAITDKEVAAHKFVAGKSPLLWDSGTGSVGGFYVRATPAGGRQYGIQYRIGGKCKRLSLGTIETWKCVDDARTEAGKKLARLRQDGIAPDVGSSGTMQAVWDNYLEALRTGRGREGKKRAGVPAAARSIVEAENHWKNHLEDALASLPPKKVTPALVRQIHADISRQRRAKRAGRGAVKSGGNYAANRAIESLRAAWNAGRGVGLTRGLPDPFEGYQANNETVRRTYIRQDQAAAFMQAIEQEPHGYREFWKLALLTGARSGELLAIEWKDVDLVARRLKFRGVEGKGTKNREIHTLPLTAGAVAAFKALPKAGARVFPFTRPKSSWKRVVKNAGLEGVRAHDVRRSVGTWLGSAGVSLSQIQATLNHKSSITSQVYVQLAQDDAAKLAALEAQDAAVAKISNVIDLAAKKAQRQTRRSA